MWMMSGVRSGYDQNLRHLKMKNLSLSLPSSLFVCWFDFPNSLKGKLVRMCVLSCSFVRVLLFTVNLVSSFLKWFRESIWMKESFSLSLLLFLEQQGFLWWTQERNCLMMKKMKEILEAMHVFFFLFLSTPVVQQHLISFSLSISFLVCGRRCSPFDLPN